MFALTSMFGLGEMSRDRSRALSIVYAASISLMMGVNFIQPALPALTVALRRQRFGIVVDHDPVHRPGDCTCRRSLASLPISMAGACFLRVV